MYEGWNNGSIDFQQFYWSTQIVDMLDY
jgi:hypothetical protein